MEITTRTVGSCTVIAVLGRLDAATSPEFDAQTAAITAEGDARCVLDFTGLDYISSAGLRSIIGLAKSLQARGGSLGLYGLSGMVEEVIAVSGFNSVLPTYTSLDQVCKE